MIFWEHSAQQTHSRLKLLLNDCFYLHPNNFNLNGNVYLNHKILNNKNTLFFIEKILLKKCGFDNIILRLKYPIQYYH